jgi:hypothetical protein
LEASSFKGEERMFTNFFIEFPRFIPGGDSALNSLNYCSVNLSPRPSLRRRVKLQLHALSIAKLAIAQNLAITKQPLPHIVINKARSINAR